MKRVAGTLITLALAFTTTATGSALPRGTSVPRSTVVRVRMVDDAFRPRVISVERGTRVRWVNAGDHLHSTTSNRDLWDSGLLEPGETFSRVFRRSGTFRYHCTAHTSMTGRVVVG